MPYLLVALKVCKGIQSDTMTTPFPDGGKEAAINAGRALSARYPHSIISLWHVEDVTSLDGTLVGAILPPLNKDSLPARSGTLR